MTNATHTIGGWMTEQVFTIGDDQSLLAARQRMHEHNIRHLPVLHGGHLVGVLSQRDIAMVESLPGVELEAVAVEEAMAEEPWTVESGASLSDVATVMAERRLGTAIVVAGPDSDRVLGVFTTTDALRALAQFSGS